MYRLENFYEKFNAFMQLIYYFEISFPLKKPIKSKRSVLKPELNDNILKLREEVQNLYSETKELDSSSSYNVKIFKKTSQKVCTKITIRCYME